MFTVYGYEPSVYNCPPCINSKRLLDARQQKYDFVSVAKTKDASGAPVLDETVVGTLESLLGTRRLTMPQIFHDGKHVGGFDQLREYVRSIK